MNRSFKRLAIVLSASCLSLTSLARAQEGGGDGPPVERHLQYAGRVLVGADGNGATTAEFPTTVAGESVHYFLLVDNGCAPSPTPTPAVEEPCTPVSSMTISLNEHVVFQTNEAFIHKSVEVALNRPDGVRNVIVLTAAGTAGSGARAAVVAVKPAEVALGGRSILPWAWSDELTRTFLTIHNAGPSVMAARIVFFNPDGSLAGESLPHILPVHATINLDLKVLATNLGLTWVKGAVHVRWAARNFSQMSTVGIEVHREPDSDGNLEITNARDLALDDYGPFPINTDELRQIFGDH
jgi:hypothetical protein